MQKLLRTPQSEDEWFILARNLLKAHMTLSGFRFAELSAALARFGIEESEVNLRNRINRGRFSAALLFQCLRAMNVGELILPNDKAS